MAPDGLDYIASWTELNCDVLKVLTESYKYYNRALTSFIWSFEIFFSLLYNKRRNKKHAWGRQND
jgi:hypothetical protein